jgi:PAS domain S-box-containing protein
MERDALSRASERPVISGTGLQPDHAREYAVLASMADAVYCVDPAGCFTFVNAAFEALTGYALADLRGAPAARLYVPEAEAVFLERRRQVYSGAPVSPSVETVLLLKDGRRLPVEVSVSSLLIEGQTAGRVAVLRDLTERKAAEEALRESEERFRHTFENAAVGIAHVGLDGHWLRVNDRLCEITGYSHEALLARTFQDITHPDDLEADLTSVRQVLAGEIATYAMEKRYIRKDGGIVWVNLTVSLVRTPSGEPDYFISVVEDITPRKQAEAALREREERYALVVGGAEAAIWDWHVPAQRVVFSPRWKALRGLSDAEVSDREDEWSSRIHPEDCERVMAAVRAHFEGRTPVFAEEYRVRHKDGRWIWILDRGIARRDAAGQVIRMAGSETDITERKQAEAALRESEARFQLLANAAPVLIWVNGPDGCEFVNRTYLEFLGVSSETDVRGYDWAPYVHPEDREAYVGGYLAAVAARRPFAAQFRFRRADGVYRWFRSVGTPRLLPDGTFLGYVGCSFDITEMREAEAELLRAQKLESIGVLAGGIAHDFNNLLTGILGNISLAKLLVSTDAKVVARLTEAEKACQRATALTQQLLTFAKGGAPVRQTVSLAPLLTESITFALRGSNVRADFRIAADLWPVDADSGQMSQVLHNVVLNAAQAMPGGGTVEVRADNVVLGAGASLSLPEGRYIKIAVQDHGCGMPRDVLPKIFDPYFTTKAAGSGLGLATVHAIVAKHDGYIRVDSQVGEGTTVVIYLPASPQTVTPAPTGPDVPLVGHGRILVMDDEAMIGDLLRASLTRLGYEVECVRDGRAAIVAYQRAQAAGQPFAAVILDSTIPGGMGGRHTLAHLRTLNPQVVALLSSGYTNDPMLANYTQYGFRGIIAKPYTVKELQEALQRVLQEGRYTP